MSVPKRIQRKRTKGWKMPEGAVYVGRPTRFGNPFAIDDPWLVWAAVSLGCRGNLQGRREAAILLYRAWLTGTLPPLAEPESGGEISFESGRTVSAHGMVLGLAGRMCAIYQAPTLPPRPDVEALRGQALACFCPLDQPCHADVLLELANGNL